MVAVIAVGFLSTGVFLSQNFRRENQPIRETPGEIKHEDTEQALFLKKEKQTEDEEAWLVKISRVPQSQDS